ncbi:hypothetical protein RRG08_053285 [Elysia crispata]|uniref:Uncharacterized protein n=1 Tax=Elysia crispata TaxID=231223 RepID=A0AAE0Z706_9GAST|nr:hypothetical protein RRG08_053285 [Elysia crispata]
MSTYNTLSQPALNSGKTFRTPGCQHTTLSASQPKTQAKHSERQGVNIQHSQPASLKLRQNIQNARMSTYTTFS